MSPSELGSRSPEPTRARPRLFKQRKRLHRKSSRVAASADSEVKGSGKVFSSSNGVSCSDFVFRAGSKPEEGLGHLDGTSGCGVHSGRGVGEAEKEKGSCFVFGAGAGGTGAEWNKDLDEREDSERVEVSFVFGANWLDSEMRKLNINGGTKESSLKDGDNNVFVFGRNGNVPASSVEQEQGSSAEVESSREDVIKGCAAASQAANMDRIETGSCERKSPDRSRAPFTEFQPPQWDPSCFKESLFTTMLQSTPSFDFKSAPKMDKGVRKSRRKLKQPFFDKQNKDGDHLQDARSSNSPMEFSPYRETKTEEQFAKDSPASLKDMEGVKHGKESSNSEEPREEIAGHCNERCCAGSDSSNGLIFVAEMSSSDPISGRPCKKKWRNAGTRENASTERMESKNPQIFRFTSGVVDATRHFQRKKYRKHVPTEPFVIAPRSNFQGGNLGYVETSNLSEFGEQMHVANTSSAEELQEACETWRLKGNRAFKNGDVSKAEEFYSHGINTAASCKVSGNCLKPLVICYSNRAAARMSLGNIRDAISDCAKAAILDPNFLKVQLRAANCYLLLGEVENALNYYNKCLESPAGVCLDRRITVEAANSLQKAQKVAECINSGAKLLEQKTPDAALSGLDITTEALAISPLSERLLEIKSWFLYLVCIPENALSSLPPEPFFSFYHFDVLLQLCKYDEVIQLCESTLDAAEKNFAPLYSDEHSVHVANPRSESCSFARVWRWHLISKSYFYTGRLEKALDLLEKIPEARPLSLFAKELKTELESTASLAVTIQDLKNHKYAGNLAVQSGRYAEAVEHYSSALSSNLQARPFAAICFCNRAAGYQALGQIADAIADCSLAIALNKKYTKAVARRAALHEMIRDYGQAASDLQRFISIIENQSDRKDGKSGTDGQSPSTKELRQAQRRLKTLEEEAKNGISLDCYLILGVKESDSASDIKKAYRKAALRHHPDKASQYLARSDSGHEGQIWKGILQEVHADADRLFKTIGEAYSVLSDPSKRQQYDLDEEIRKVAKQKGKTSHWNTTSESHGYPFERSNQRRNSQDNWRSYGNFRGHYYRW